MKTTITSPAGKPNGVAPGGSAYRLGGKGGRVAIAWQHIWDRLDKSEFKDATVIAAEVAELTDLKPVTLISHMHRMANDGYLAAEVRLVKVPVQRAGETFDANRRHTFYRIEAQ